MKQLSFLLANISILIFFFCTINGMDYLIEYKEGQSEEPTPGQAIWHTAQETSSRLVNYASNKIHPCQDPTNVVCFQLSLSNRMEKWGERVLPDSFQKGIQPLLDYAERPTYSLFVMNKETMQRNPGVSVLSASDAMWVNVYDWVKLTPEQREHLVAKHISIPHTVNSLKNLVEISSYVAITSGTLFTAKKIMQSKNGKFPALVATITTASALHRTGITRDILKSFKYQGDVIPFSPEEEHEANNRAEKLLVSYKTGITSAQLPFISSWAYQVLSVPS